VLVADWMSTACSTQAVALRSKVRLRKPPGDELSVFRALRRRVRIVVRQAYFCIDDDSEAYISQNERRRVCWYRSERTQTALDGRHDAAGDTVTEGLVSRGLVDRCTAPIGLVVPVDVIAVGGTVAAGKRYPVLYLFDGQMLFDRCTSQPFPDEWHVDQTLTDLIAKKAVDPLIVVGIDNAGSDRSDEYSRYGAIANAPQKLSAFMMTEVLPLIDGRYRTVSDRAHRGVGGASLASVAALTLLLDQPDTFGLGLLESTSLQNGNGRVLQETSPVVQGPLRISIGVGTAEVPPTEAAAHGFPDFDDAFVAMSQTLAENLKRSLMNHPEVKLTIEQGGQHQPRYWSERFGLAVSFLFPTETESKK
jgi:enterochelin esterase-like enzyme